MQWNENVSLLKTIVTEIIQEQMIPPQLHNAIFTDFDKLSAYYGNNLGVYNYDYNVINKEFLSRLHNSMQTMNKVVHDGDQGDMLITKDQIMNKRQNEFNQQLKNITDDFNKHTIQRPEDIDFSDKTDISLSNIDTLIKAEMEKRDIEINKKIDEADIKKAEEWFANKNTTITKVENQTTKKQTKHKTKNQKQVSFQDNESKDNESQDNVKVDNLIQQLQHDRNKLASYDVQDEKTIEMDVSQHTHKHAITDTIKNAKPGQAIIDSPVKVYNYNTLLINTHCTVTKELFFMKSPINISLNNFKLLYVEIYKNKILLHKSECFLQETNNHLNYYRLTVPFKDENNDVEIRIFDEKKNKLIPSLDTILMKEEIITKDIVLYYNILPLGGIDIDNIFLVKVDNENCSIIRSMYDLEITCNDVKIDEFIPIFVKTIERKEKETIINIENIYDINNFNYLIMSKKYEQLLMDNDMITCISKKTMILTE